MTFVAVTCSHSYKEERSYINDSYVQALEEAGAIPILLPPSLSPEKSVRALERADGLFFTGGPDMSPLLTGHQPLPNHGYIHPERDAQEIALFKAAQERRLPIMGVCRGIQVINLLMGGKISQHLADNRENAIQHQQQAPSWYGHHNVDVREGTILAKALGKQGNVAVNSFHHQGVIEVAPGLQASAVAPDGVIEAIESVSPWILGTQFHPEKLYPRHGEFLNVFHAFVAACRGES